MGKYSPLDDNPTIGNYEIIEKLGGRNHDSVYRGLDTEFGRAAVIRVPRENISWTPEMVEHFRREYAAAASLRHPNIAEIYEIGRERTSLYLAMESLGSQNLGKLIEQKAALPAEKKLALLIQAANGLSHAHKNNVRHLGLAPDKIHITPGGEAKIRNFYIAHLLAQYPPPPERGYVPVYVAPEKIEGKTGDERSDIFSLGAIFYEFFTFLRPFPGGAAETTFPDFEHFSEIPPGLWIILKTCLARNPGDRYNDMDELAAAAGELLDNMAEDRKLMQNELYAAIDPLSRFVSKPGISPEESSKTQQLLDEIRKLTDGKAENHYALLERLLNRLIAQYPLIQTHTADSEAAVMEPPAAPQMEKSPEPPQTIHPSMDADTGLEPPSTSEEIITDETAETAGADSVMPAGDTVEICETCAVDKPLETPEKAESTNRSPEAETRPTPSITPPSAEPIAKPLEAQASRPQVPEKCEPMPAFPAKPEGSATVSTDKTTNPVAAGGQISSYRNLDQLMDELLQSNPGLQDYDNSAEFDMFAPWGTLPNEPEAQPDEAPVDVVPAAPQTAFPEEFNGTPAFAQAAQSHVNTADVSNIKETGMKEPVKAADIKLPLSAPIDSGPALSARPRNLPPDAARPVFPEMDKRAGIKSAPSAPENASNFVNDIFMEGFQSDGKEKQWKSQESLSSSAPLSNAESNAAERSRKRHLRTNASAKTVSSVPTNDSSREPVLSSKLIIVLAAVFCLLLVAGVALKNNSKRQDESEKRDQAALTEEAEVPEIPEIPAFDFSAFEAQAQEEQKVSEPQNKALDDEGKRRVTQISKMIDEGNLQTASTELTRLRRLYPGAPELARLNTRLQAAEKTAKTKAAEREAEEKLQAQRRQREDELRQQATRLLAGGRYDEAVTALTVWLGEYPSSANAQELAAKIEAIRKNLNTYSSSLADRRYDEASAALRRLEQLNPGDPNLSGLRRQIESRVSNARANLTIYRLGGSGSLQMDGRAIGRNGELESEFVPVGRHTITVEHNGKPAASQNINFFEGQRMVLVYDLAKNTLRPMTEADRAVLTSRRALESGYSFDVEHPHGTLRGSCQGTLKVTDLEVSFRPFSGDHDFYVPAQSVKVGKIDGRSVELLDAGSNQRIQTYRFKENQDLQQFRKILDEAHAAK